MGHWIGATALTLLVGGCGGIFTPPADEAALCWFGQSSNKLSIIMHMKYTGKLLVGDILVADYQEKEIDEIASARARPKEEIYESERRTDCYDESGDYWYPCLVKVEIDLRPAVGTARAKQMSSAKHLAVLNCEQATVTIASEALETTRFHAIWLECETVEEEYCGIPPAGQPAPTE